MWRPVIWTTREMKTMALGNEAVGNDDGCLALWDESSNAGPDEDESSTAGTRDNDKAVWNKLRLHHGPALELQWWDDPTPSCSLASESTFSRPRTQDLECLEDEQTDHDECESVDGVFAPRE